VRQRLTDEPPDFHRDTALMAAVSAGSIAAIKLLIAAGADVNATDQAGRTAFSWPSAVDGNDPSVRHRYLVYSVAWVRFIPST
jgi:Ankyrin repeat